MRLRRPGSPPAATGGEPISIAAEVSEIIARFCTQCGAEQVFSHPSSVDEIVNLINKKTLFAETVGRYWRDQAHDAALAIGGPALQGRLGGWGAQTEALKHAAADLKAKVDNQGKEIGSLISQGMKLRDQMSAQNREYAIMVDDLRNKLKVASELNADQKITISSMKNEINNLRRANDYKALYENLRNKLREVVE